MVAYFAAAKKELLDLKTRGEKKYREVRRWSDTSWTQQVWSSQLRSSELSADAALRSGEASEEFFGRSESRGFAESQPEPQLQQAPVRPASRLFWLRPPRELSESPATNVPIKAVDDVDEDLDGLGSAEPARRSVLSIAMKSRPRDWGVPPTELPLSEVPKRRLKPNTSRMGWVQPSTDLSAEGSGITALKESLDGHGSMKPARSMGSVAEASPAIPEAEPTAQTPKARAFPEKDMIKSPVTASYGKEVGQRSPPHLQRSPPQLQRSPPQPSRSSRLQPPSSPTSPSLSGRGLGTWNLSRTNSPPMSSRLTPPPSPQPGELSPEEGPLLSLYERSEKSRMATQNDWERSSQGSVASDAAYNEELRSARANLKTALVAEKKDLTNSYSRVSMSVMERVENVIKDLVRKGREDKQDARTRSPQAVHLSPSGSALFSPGSSFLQPSSPISPSLFPGKGSKGSKELSFNMSRNDTVMSSQLSGSLDPKEQTTVAQEAADDDEDYDSEDEEKMLQRYAQRCNAEVAENLRSILMQSGHHIPSMPSGGNEETRAQVSDAVKQEILEYQQTIQDRLERLGAVTSAMRSTTDPSEAVKDALFRYHVACNKLGKLYAFEKPKQELAPDMGERRQIARYVRDLKDLEPGRYAPKTK